MPRLENYVIPEVFSNGHAFGEIYDDPRFEDGTFVRTSKVIRATEKELVTKNTTYALGKKAEQ